MKTARKPPPWSGTALGGALRRSFVEGASWPVDPAGLSALVDMGLSDDQIATYFSIGPADVVALRDRYRLRGEVRK